MKVIKVGTTFLSQSKHGYAAQQHDKIQAHTKVDIHKQYNDRRPIVTPYINVLNESSISNTVNENSTNGLQQYLLIPNSDHIQVLSSDNGQCILKLLLSNNTTNTKSKNTGNIQISTSADIHTVTMTNILKGQQETNHGHQKEWVILAGCSDGTIHEWTLDSIAQYHQHNTYDKDYTKKFIYPRRVFQILSHIHGDTKHITHLSNLSRNDHNASDTLFGIMVQDVVSFSLITIFIPSFHQTSNHHQQDGIDCQYITTYVHDYNKEIGNDGDFHVNLKQTFYTADYKTHRKKSKDENDQKDERSLRLQSSPIRLLSSSLDIQESKNDNVTLTDYKSDKMCSFVVLLIKNEFIVYYEDYSDYMDGEILRFKKAKNEAEITTAAISSNGHDLAVGYNDGTINIMVQILPLINQYWREKKLNDSVHHPKDNIVKRTLHWHSLPVKSLCYMSTPGSHAAPTLLSGGEEAVLVTWNLERGFTRPTHTLPRIAKGCITHITSNSYTSSTSHSKDAGIVIRCMDDTVQYILGHNHSVRWKIQGLATCLNECSTPLGKQADSSGVILRIDPRTNLPILTNLPGAPGFIHWYDPQSGCVVGELEAAPYNRISRKEAGHLAYPRPNITHLVLSNSGDDMITIDTMLSENKNVGALIQVDKRSGEEMSMTTNIKFWHWSNDLEQRNSRESSSKGMPFEMIAAMPSPHGLFNGQVDALAISPDGSRACSLSHQEGFFHVWVKNEVKVDAKSPSIPAWSRLYKIAIPGHARSTSVKYTAMNVESTVSFSNDGSVLAVASGSTITLWDHVTATLLNSVHAADDVREIYFSRSPMDMMLAIGFSSVSMLSTVGDGYLGDGTWSYKLAKNLIIDDAKVELGIVTPLLSRKEIAVTLKATKTGSNSKVTTRIVVIDSLTGRPKQRMDGSPLYHDIDGNVCCLSDLSQTKASWTSDTASIVVLTDHHDMYMIEIDEKQNGEADHSTTRIPFSRKMKVNTNTALVSNDAPKISEYPPKRLFSQYQSEDDNKAKDSFGLFLTGNHDDLSSGLTECTVPSSQLPPLSAAFSQAFLGRKFRKVASP